MSVDALGIIHTVHRIFSQFLEGAGTEVSGPSNAGIL